MGYGSFRSGCFCYLAGMTERDLERVIVDALEGEWVRLERGEHAFDVPRVWLPPGTREGDALMVHVQDGLVQFSRPLGIAALGERRAAQERLNALNAEADDDPIDL